MFVSCFFDLCKTHTCVLGQLIAYRKPSCCATELQGDWPRISQGSVHDWGFIGSLLTVIATNGTEESCQFIPALVYIESGTPLTRFDSCFTC